MNPEEAEIETKMRDATSMVLNQLRMEQKLCDVVIETEDVKFKAHKIILCGCSSYFRALFSGAWATDQLVYSIPGVSAEIMAHIISFAYTNSLHLTDETVKPVLEAADQLLIPGLVQKCGAYLENKLSPMNCLTTWRVLHLYNCSEHTRKTFLYILQHFEEIVEVSEEFLLLSVDQLGFIIQNDFLRVRNESVVFEAVLRWINHLPEERRGFIAGLLAMVRLGLMNEFYLVNTVFENKMVDQTRDCIPIMYDAISAYTDFLCQRHSDAIYRNLLSRPRMPSSILLVTGGRDGFVPAPELEAYDSRADRWLSFSPTPIYRIRHGTAVLNNDVYLIGGCSDVAYLNSVVKIQLPSFTWIDVAFLNNRRSSVSVAVLNGLIYAMGGQNSRALRSVECYHPELNRWTLVAPMHSRRAGASATTLNGKVYICGGSNGYNSTSTAEHYDPETNTWTMIASMRVARTGLGVVTYKGLIYAVGGMIGLQHLNTCERFDPETNRWSQIPSMFNRRSYFGIEVMDDQLYVVGGYNETNMHQNVECYDEEIGIWFSVAPINAPRSCHSCCVVPGLYELTSLLFARPPLKSTNEEEAAGGPN